MTSLDRSLMGRNGRPSHGPSLCGAGLRGLQPPRRPSILLDGALSDCVLGRYVPALQPRGDRTTVLRVARSERSHTRPWRSSSMESRCRQRIRSRRTCSRASAARPAAYEDYFCRRLDLSASYELGGRGEMGESLELVPEPMYRALEDVVCLVVDGECDELRDPVQRSAQSRGAAPSCRGGLPRALLLPRRKTSGVEAITKPDDRHVPRRRRTTRGPLRVHQ